MKAHILILMVICHYAKAESLKTIKADSLLKKNIIGFKAQGLGGHSGYCIEVEVENYSNKTLQIEIESGRRFVSFNNSEQDILVVKSSVVTVQPKSKFLTKLFGFCCQSSMSSPKKNSQYLTTYMAPKEWQSLTQYLDSNIHISQGANQMAIWALSDKVPIQNIGGSNSEDKLLRMRLAGILKQSIPWYNLEYGEESLIPGNNIDSISPKMFHADIDLTVPHARSITATIVDKDKKTIKVLTQYYYIRDGLQTFSITQSLKNYKKGKYFLVITGENGYKIEKEFKI